MIQKPDAHRTLSSVTRPIDCDWESRTLAVTSFRVQPPEMFFSNKILVLFVLCCTDRVVFNSKFSGALPYFFCLTIEVWAGHNTQMFMWIFHLSRYSNPRHKVLITRRNFFYVNLCIFRLSRYGNARHVEIRSQHANVGWLYKCSILGLTGTFRLTTKTTCYGTGNIQNLKKNLTDRKFCYMPLHHEVVTWRFQIPEVGSL